MARRRKRLVAAERRPAETRPAETMLAETRPIEHRPVEASPTRPVETRPTETRPSETRPVERRPVQTRPAETRPSQTRPEETRPEETRNRVGEGQSNGIPDDNTNETTTENIIENSNNPSNGRKQVQVVNGLFDKSSECSREITKIFKERIDDTGYTWTKVSQSTKNFYFGEFKKHFLWDPETETTVRKAWDAKASGRYADFFRDIRAIMVKPVFMSDIAWINFTTHWNTSKYKEIQAKNRQNRLKGEGSSTHTGGSISFHEHAKNLESKYNRPPTGFELFFHTHTSGHDKKTFINEKSKNIHDNVLRLRQERDENSPSSESNVDDTTLYIEAAGGAKKRKLYGAGSKAADYIKDISSGNETTGITKVNDGLEKKKMERKIKKLNKTLEIVCSRFNITLPDSDSDTDEGDARQAPGTSHSQAGDGEEDDHDSRMIAS